MRYRSLPRHRDEGGFALLLLVVMLVAVAGLLLDRGLRARTEYLQAINAGGEIRARAAAQAGVDHAVSRLRALLRQPESRSDPLTGLATHALRDRTLHDHLARVGLAPGVSYGVRIEDMGARLHLNQATEEELRALFVAVGAGFREADVAAQSVMDWRDADELHRGRGAEWDDWYRHQPFPVHPRNARFESVDELRQVRGMETLYSRVAPHLTVFGDGRINVNSASIEVLRSLPGLDPESVAEIMARRRGSRPLQNVFEIESRLSTPSRQRLQQAMQAFLIRASFDSQVMEITSTGRVEGLPFDRTVRAIAVRVGTTVQVVRSFEE